VIRFTDFSFKYNDIAFPVLQNINLHIDDGEFVLIAGPSGNGKTTLIRVLNGLIPHFYGGNLSGSVSVLGKDVFTTPTRMLAKDVGIVFQNPENQLFMNNVENEIVFGMENLGFSRTQMKQKLEYFIDFFGFRGMNKRDVSSLSGGEKQKLAIASVLAMEPKILVLDEPTSELDPKTAEDIFNLLTKIREQFHLTIILIEHRLDRVLSYVQRVILLDKGKIIKDSTPEDVFLSSFDINSVGITVPPYIDLIRKLYSIDSIKPTGVSTRIREIMRQALLQNNVIPSDTISNLKISNLFTILSKFLASLLDEIRKDPGNKRFPLSGLKDTSSLTKKLVVELKNVRFSYRTNVNILKNINLSIHAGEFIAIIGRNGSGKTTLLKHFIKLLQPNAGVVLLNGSEIRQKTIAEISKDVGFLFQNPSIQFYQDNLEEEIRFVLDNFNNKGLEPNTTIDDILNQFGLLKYKNTYARYLSIGEQQKAALATILSVKPKILVLDEPMHGMDAKQRSIFFQYLKNYQEKGNTIIMVSHDIETIARCVDRIVVLTNGEITDDGNVKDVLSKQSVFSTKIHNLIQSTLSILNDQSKFSDGGINERMENFSKDLLKIHTVDALYDWIIAQVSDFQTNDNSSIDNSNIDNSNIDNSSEKVGGQD
jgi:energy-coupling factor transporter ATP-binding protein EcfA2